MNSSPITIVPFLNKVNAVIINPILQVLFVIATIYLIISIIKLINADAKTKETARTAVLWSIVGMFVMVSVYGIINLVLASFKIDNPAYLQTGGKQ